MSEKGYTSYRGSQKNPSPTPDPSDKKIDPPIIAWLKRQRPGGFQGHSLFDVGKYFLRSLFKEDLNIRATSLSFQFFLALFPAVLFLFTLIAYIPIRGFKTRLIKELDIFLPDNTYKAVAQTINDILNQQNGGLLSFGFLLAIYFASNGFHTLINTFNRRLPHKKRRNWIQNRGLAVSLTFLIAFFFITGVFLIFGMTQLQVYMIKHHWASRAFLKYFFLIFDYGIWSLLVFFSISSLYYFAPANVSKWKFISAGSILASVLCLISTFGFSVYVNNFNSYNKIYGSIGAIIALMILIYINTLSIIVGFELNTSIDKASLQQKINANAQ